MWGTQGRPWRELRALRCKDGSRHLVGQRPRDRNPPTASLRAPCFAALVASPCTMRASDSVDRAPPATGGPARAKWLDKALWWMRSAPSTTSRMSALSPSPPMRRSCARPSVASLSFKEVSGRLGFGDVAEHLRHDCLRYWQRVLQTAGEFVVQQSLLVLGPHACLAELHAVTQWERRIQAGCTSPFKPCDVTESLYPAPAQPGHESRPTPGRQLSHVRPHAGKKGILVRICRAAKFDGVTLARGFLGVGDPVLVLCERRHDRRENGNRRGGHENEFRQE